MVPALAITDLTKIYTRRGRHGAPSHSTVAADSVSFTAGRGAITAVLGPNGAGKTTTLECCEGLRSPDSGAVEVLGRERRTPSDDQWLRERVGVMVQSGGLPMAPRAREVLHHVARFYSTPSDLSRLTAALALDDVLDTQIRRLSGGQRQRLAVACALAGRPELAFLDEPTSGVDPHARRSCWELLREQRDAGTAVVLTTHHIDEAEVLADHVVIMAAGRVVASGTVAELAHGHLLRVSGARSPDRVRAILRRVGTESDVADSGANGDANGKSSGGAASVAVLVEDADARLLADVSAALVAAGEGGARVALSPRTLESVYLDLTRGRSVA